MNIDNITQLEQALKDGHKVRNVRYNQNEWLQLIDDCIIDESDIKRGSLTSHWWNTHIHALPMRWHIFESKDK